MNIGKYINMLLLSASDKYQFSLIEIKTYKHKRKYSNLRLIIYEYIINEDGEEDKKEYKVIEANTERELLLKVKEMI